MKTNFKKINVVWFCLMIVFIASNLYAEVKIINSNKENFRLTIKDDPYQKEYEAAKVRCEHVNAVAAKSYVDAFRVHVAEVTS